MPPQFFVKFQYNGKIKKLGLTEEEFTWNNMSTILSQSFGLPKDRLKLTYKDPEGDEITACCDEDLIEAYRACSSLQPLRFFVYLCNNAHSSQQRNLPVQQDSLNSSKQEEPQEKFVKELKMKSEPVLPDPIPIMESQKVQSEGVIKHEDILVEEKPTEINTEEIGRVLEEILLTKEAKEKILQLRDRVNNGQQSNSGYKVNIDEKMLADCVAGIFNKVLNETIAIDVDEKVNSTLSAVASLEDISKKISMSKDWKSMEQEKSYQVRKGQSATQSNIFNTSLKESIYERSVLSSVKEQKTQDFKEKSFAETSVSFCKDLSSTYGVKLALKLENGKMRLVSVPTQEYSIIDSVDNLQKDRSEASSNFRRSASMNVCPDVKKSGSPDYSEYVRLSLVD